MDDKRVRTKKELPLNEGKKQRPKLKRFDPLQELKMEIAAELGLLEKVNTNGWDSLSAQEAGRIGGHMTQRLKSSKE